MARNRHDRSGGSFKRGRPQKRVSSDAFLIVTEGHVTEPEYFNALVRALRMGAIDVKVAPSTIGSDPFSVVEHADTLNKERNRAVRKGDPTWVKYDQVWVVFDQEGIENGRDWQNAIHQAEAKGFNVVFSNPSFEFWLLLHHTYTTSVFANSDAVEHRLKQEDVGYTKRRGRVNYAGIYLPKTETAIVNARRVRADHAVSGADNPCTDADKLVITLNGSVQAHNQLFKNRDEWENDTI